MGINHKNTQKKNCKNFKKGLNKMKKIEIIPRAIIPQAMQPNYGSLMFPFGPHHMSPSKLKCPSSGSAT